MHIYKLVEHVLHRFAALPSQRTVYGFMRWQDKSNHTQPCSNEFTAPTEIMLLNLGNQRSKYVCKTEPDGANGEYEIQRRKRHLPVMLHNSRSVGASPPYWFSMPFCDALGTGTVMVMGLWNLRRRGSTVTMGLTATRLPSILATRSAGTGWA